MKLIPKAVVHVGKERFRDEIPDEIARSAGLLKDKPARKAVSADEEAQEGEQVRK